MRLISYILYVVFVSITNTPFDDDDLALIISFGIDCDAPLAELENNIKVIIIKTGTEYIMEFVLI